MRQETQGISALVLVMVAAASQAAGPAAGIESTYPEHTRAVELARAGRYDDGLAILQELLRRFPDDYPLQRDAIVILAWKGDCPGALAGFERVRNRTGLEPYLAIPVSDCLLAANRPKEARRLTRLATARHPDDAGLRDAFLKADFVLRVDKGLDEDSPAAEGELYSDSSDQGLTEWVARAEGSLRVADNTRLYARYRGTRATDPQYANGDLDRAGLGVRYRFDERWLLDQEISADLLEGRGGATTRVTFEPRDAWRLDAAYASYSESLPLRARAAGVAASQWTGEARYERRDYRWEWLASIHHFEFTDHNRRTVFFTTAGYAWEMRARREQRLFVEWYQSANSLDATAYFNPSRDASLGVSHRTDFVHDSRYQRHVDHLWVSVAAYTQEGYDTLPRSAVRYEQEYDFDQANTLVAGTGVARNAYDGRFETEWRLYLRYHRRF